MKTVKELADFAGISVRTLHYYDEKGVLKPSVISESGYRYYDEKAEEKLMTILLFKELRFSLEEIRHIVSDRNFDREKALKEQIELLKLERQRLSDIIDNAEKLLKNGGNIEMSFRALDKKKIEEYKAEAKERYGTTKEYIESEAKRNARTEAENDSIDAGLMQIFKDFGTLKGSNPNSAEAKATAKRLMDYITANYYKCNKQILLGLADMYVYDERFKSNIDDVGGEGTAEFARNAIIAFANE